MAGISAVILAFLPAACTVGPDYLRPSAPEPVAYKELKGWKRATPRDEIDRGPWWSVFGDRELDSFEPQVEISNQNVAAAEAAYRQTLAVIKQAQAGLFPVITVSYSETRSHIGQRAIGNPLGAGVTRNIF
ncbi:MAG: efflux transporter outer membrane subunit, partial [Methylocella sp.]